ncbi:Transcriptional repressor FrmR [Starkeya nomas]|uniref:Transcriptional repressor FrmR n=2 Tax=Xanthobacteraceae TaxID=335928 RepID=A0A5S9ND23_9HYPH|nr:Transcriptional repressor FrmR [Starkeya nomas]
MEAIERALESEVPCADILNQVASVRGAVNGLTAELIEDHIREHVAKAEEGAREEGVAELVDVIRTYMR